MKNKIIYIGNFGFPDRNAAGKRVHGNGRALSELGYELIYIGMNQDVKVNSLKEFEDTKRQYGKELLYEFSYPGGKEWINYKKIFNIFEQFLKTNNLAEEVAYVVFYGSVRISLFMSKVLKMARKNNIKVLTDCVDWIEVKSGNILFDMIKKADTYYQKGYMNKKVDGVIVISSYLEKYYQKSGCKTVIIPPLSLDKIEKAKIEEPPVIIYAGNTFRNHLQVKDVNSLKDRVDKMVLFLTALKEEGALFRFLYYGTTKSDFLAALPFLAKDVEVLGDVIEFMGHVPNDAVMKKTKEAAFTILVRDRNRTSMAGFPTKISESIACGTPVITTRTSDIDVYLQEGRQAVYILPEKREDIKKIKRILDEKYYEVMRDSIPEKHMFYYGNYIDKLKHFLEKV